jgi:hypothetical protein
VFAVNTDILGEMRRAATVPVTAADLQKLFVPCLGKSSFCVDSFGNVLHSPVEYFQSLQAAVFHLHSNNLTNWLFLTGLRVS